VKVSERAGARNAPPTLVDEAAPVNDLVVEDDCPVIAFVAVAWEAAESLQPPRLIVEPPAGQRERTGKTGLADSDQRGKFPVSPLPTAWTLMTLGLRCSHVATR
jgi:hypothetical protein